MKLFNDNVMNGISICVTLELDSYYQFFLERIRKQINENIYDSYSLPFPQVIDMHLRLHPYPIVLKKRKY